MMPSGRWRVFWNRLAYAVFLPVLWLLFSLRMKHRHRMPRYGACLVIANHESFLDPPLVGVVAFPRILNFVARKTLFKNPWLAFFMDRQGAFPIDQEGSGADGIKTTLTLLQQGRAVCIFPEGTRTDDGAIKDLMPGIALLIRRAKVPVVPIGLAGLYEAWPMHRKFPALAPLFWPARRGAIAAVIGETLPVEPLLAMKPSELLVHLKSVLQTLKDEADALRRKPSP